MRIAIEARALSAKGGGVKNYIHLLVRNLSTIPEIDLTVIRDQEKEDGLPSCVKKVVAPLKHELLLSYWLNSSVNRSVKSLQPDLVHFTKAAVLKRKTLPTVVTIYDVIPILFPESQKLIQRWYWPQTLRHAAQTSDRIITISEASKNDLVRLFNVDPNKITVTPLAVDAEHFQPQEKNKVEQVVQSYHINTPYIFFVGTLEPRKNVPLLIRAFAQIAKNIPHTLVIAGRPDHDFENIKQAAKESGLTDRIKLVEFVPYQDLPCIYAGADLFVWPSVYEGWGLPPQEAMACGTPTIVSDGGALPEVVGNAGEIVRFAVSDIRDRTHDDNFEQALADRIESVLATNDRQNQLKHDGLTRVVQRTWADVAKETVEAYKLTLSDN